MNPTTPRNSILIPTVIEKTPGGERAYDIYSRLLNCLLYTSDAADE